MEGSASLWPGQLTLASGASARHYLYSNSDSSSVRAGGAIDLFCSNAGVSSADVGSEAR
jgi:hypothetical protein